MLMIWSWRKWDINLYRYWSRHGTDFRNCPEGFLWCRRLRWASVSQSKQSPFLSGRWRVVHGGGHRALWSLPSDQEDLYCLFMDSCLWPLSRRPLLYHLENLLLLIQIAVCLFHTSCWSIGGQYYWASRLAPKKYARFLSYTTGYLGWAGSVVVSGSVAVGLAQAIVGMIILANPDVYRFVTYVSDLRLYWNLGWYSWPTRSSTSLPSG